MGLLVIEQLVKNYINLSETFDKEIVKVSPLQDHLFLRKHSFFKVIHLGFFLPNKSGHG